MSITNKDLLDEARKNYEAMVADGNWTAKGVSSVLAMLIDYLYLESQAAPQETTTAPSDVQVEALLTKHMTEHDSVFRRLTPETLPDAPACEHMIAGNHSRDRGKCLKCGWPMELRWVPAGSA